MVAKKRRVKRHIRNGNIVEEHTRTIDDSGEDLNDVIKTEQNETKKSKKLNKLLFGDD